MDWQEFCDQNIPAPHTITVEAYQGPGARGPVYATAVDVTPCVVQHTRRRVPVQTADAAGGIVTSSTTVWCPPGTIAPPNSRVTLPSGAVTRVLTTDALDAHGHELPEHVELSLE